MLQAPHWQRRRARFAQLLETVRGRRQPLVALPVEVLPPASIRGAGPLGWLTADLVCAVVEQLARLAGTDAPAAVRDVAALLGACRYVEACFREHGDSLRLDVAARGQTALVPRHLSTSARPYLDQLMLEERSRFDVRMLESAVNAMVTHCGGQHCRGARWAHNRRLERPAPERPPTPLLAAVLEGNRPPRVRVAWTARAWALPTPPDCEQCWIGINDAPNSAFELIRVGKHPARVLDPRSELDQVERFRGTAPAPEMNVSAVCISPCGRWIAVASRTRPAPGGEPPPAASSAWGAVDDAHDDVGLVDARDQRVQTCVCIWRVASGALVCTRQVPYAPRVRAVWFREEGGQLLLVLLTGSARFDHHATHALHQFCVDSDGFVQIAPRSLQAAWSDGVRARSLDVARPVPHADDAPLSRLKAVDRARVIRVHPLGRFCILTFVGAVRLAGPEVPPVEHVWQTVRVDCAAARDASSPLDKAIEAVSRLDPFLQPTWWENETRFLPFSATSSSDTKRVIALGARHIFEGRRLHVQIYDHDGDKYVQVHSVHVEYAIKRAPTGGRTCDAVTVVPSAACFALSPCERFVVFGLSNAELRYTFDDVERTAGLCVLDLADVRLGSTGFGWVPCRPDLVPRVVRWNKAGLWLEAREGVLLLGV